MNSITRFPIIKRALSPKSMVWCIRCRRVGRIASSTRDGHHDGLVDVRLSRVCACNRFPGHADRLLLFVFPGLSLEVVDLLLGMFSFLSPGREIDVYLCQFPPVNEVAFATLVAMSVCTSERGKLPSYVVGVRSHCSRRPQVVLDMSKYNMSRKSISWKPVVMDCSVGLRHLRSRSAIQQSRNV